MRDIIVVSIVLVAALAALRRPWIGVVLWAWLSLMNPHRYCYGFAHDAPVAQIAMACTLLGMVFNAEQIRSPFRGSPVVWLLIFMLWITLSWCFGVDPTGDTDQWSKVMKIDFAILLSLALLRTKKQLMAMMWVTTLSLAILGAKGGIFTLLGGGTERVWGPPNSFIEDNNEFGLAMVMTVPMLRFLQMQVQSVWGRRVLTLTMLVCTVSALGSQSRGALLATSSMAFLLWWNGRNRIVGGVFFVLTAMSLLAFMPETWMERMQTINHYDTDGSALGRLGAWSNAWNLAFDYPFGVGFDAARQELFDRYSSMPEVGARAAHSIYFQVLGNHGFIGLFIFLMLWISTWINAAWLRKHGGKLPQTKWCADLGSMMQVAMLGYFVGGAFLSLSYFDLPYDIMIVVVLTRCWVTGKEWEKEPLPVPDAEPTRTLGATTTKMG